LGVNGANLYGYVGCKLGHNPGISDATGILSKFVLQGATQPSASAADEPNAFKAPNVQSI